MPVPLALDAALAGLLGLIPRPVPARGHPAAEAVGLVLAADLRAGAALPPAPVALHAGWPVAAADTEGCGPYAPWPLAGTPLAPGDPLPAGADAVLPPGLAADGAAVGAVAAGEGVRAAGGDLPAGHLVRAAGTRLRAGDLPAAAALGHAVLRVRVPRVALRGAGALGPWLAALVRAEGGQVVTGAADLALAVGEAPVPRGVGLRPGAEAGFGRWDGVPTVLLPAPPGEAWAAWLALARPALRRLAGAAPAPAPTARLTRKVASDPGLAELVALALDGGDATPLAVGPAAASLRLLAAADAWLLVPAAREGHAAGAVVALVAP